MYVQDFSDDPWYKGIISRIYRKNGGGGGGGGGGVISFSRRAKRRYVQECFLQSKVSMEMPILSAHK